MKRREFLSAAAGGVVGSVVPAVAWSQAKPCPPASFGVVQGTTATTECVAPGAAPSWFTSLPERQWIAMAGAAGQRLIDVYHGANLGYGATFSTMAAAWTGGCVDEDRGELVFAANGGHGDYVGNEVYACSLRSETPRWYRLTDPSPASAVAKVFSDPRGNSTSNTTSGQGYVPNGFAAMFADGRMRSVHGWHSCLYARGRVWYPHQSSPSGIGYSTPHAWSFNRNATGIPTSPGGAPLAWANNPGPWKWLGTSDSGARGETAKGEGFGTAPPAALDPVTGKIWMANAAVATRVWMSLDTETEEIRRSDNVNIYADNTGQDGRWAVVVVDTSGQDRWRLWVAPAPDAKGLIVLDLKSANPYAASAWSVQPVSNLAAVSVPGLGAVYHPASTAILLSDPKSLQGGQILKLRVPTNSDGTFNPSATWQVSTVAPASGSANPTAGTSTANNGAWSKFNIVKDMGNGQSALVVCMEVDRPTYVYKLPVRGV